MSRASSQRSPKCSGKASRNSDEETNTQSKFALSRTDTKQTPTSDPQSKGLEKGDDKSSKESSNKSGGSTSVAASVAVNIARADNEASVASGVSLGASGHVEVQASQTVEAVAQGLSTATNTKAKTGVAAAVGLNIVSVDNAAEVGSGATLSGGDVRVRADMADGKANKEIASELSISERTVKTHLGHLFEKLGVTSRTEAVKVATRRGLVRLQ